LSLVAAQIANIVQTGGEKPISPDGLAAVGSGNGIFAGLLAPANHTTAKGTAGLNASTALVAPPSVGVTNQANSTTAPTLPPTLPSTAKLPGQAPGASANLPLTAETGGTKANTNAPITGTNITPGPVLTPSAGSSAETNAKPGLVPTPPMGLSISAGGTDPLTKTTGTYPAPDPAPATDRPLFQPGPRSELPVADRSAASSGANAIAARQPQQSLPTTTAAPTVQTGGQAIGHPGAAPSPIVTGAVQMVPASAFASVSTPAGGLRTATSETQPLPAAPVQVSKSAANKPASPAPSSGATPQPQDGKSNDGASKLTSNAQPFGVTQHPTATPSKPVDQPAATISPGGTTVTVQPAVNTAAPAIMLAEPTPGNSGPVGMTSEKIAKPAQAGSNPAPGQAANANAKARRPLPAITALATAPAAQRFAERLLNGPAGSQTDPGAPITVIQPATLQSAQPGQIQLAALPATSDPAPVLAAQVSAQIAQRAAKGDGRFEIRLDPPELGRVDVRMKVADDGTVRAHLIVERSETLEMFTRDRSALERTLEQAGYRTEDGGLQFSLKHQSAGQGQTGSEPEGPAKPATSEHSNSKDDADPPPQIYASPGSDHLDIRV